MKILLEPLRRERFRRSSHFRKIPRCLSHVVLTGLYRFFTLRRVFGNEDMLCKSTRYCNCRANGTQTRVVLHSRLTLLRGETSSIAHTPPYNSSVNLPFPLWLAEYAKKLCATFIILPVIFVEREYSCKTRAFLSFSSSFYPCKYLSLVLLGKFATSIGSDKEATKLESPILSGDRDQV